MASTPIDPTNITPPRVPFIDERTGAISREWYRFFLSLFDATKATQDTIATPPDTASMTASLESRLDSVEYLASVTPRAELGTIAAYNIDYLPYIGFDTAPSWIGTTAGQFWYNSSTGAFNAKMGNNNITQQVGEELYVYGKASAAITDSPLQIVYQTGTVGASGTITFGPTVASITNGDLIIGVATEPLAHNEFGRITSYGIVHGITTDGSAFGETWADGDAIWYNPVTGNPTNVKPVAPNIKVQVGTLIKAGAGGSGSSAR